MLYRREVMLVYRQSMSLANGFDLPDDEIRRRIDDWTEFFLDKIPRDKLSESFGRASDKHATDFPISAYEILSAWREIESAENERQIEIAEKRAEIERDQIYTPHWSPVCDVCFDTGFAPVKRTFAGRQYSGVIDCRSCEKGSRRYEARKRAETNCQ